MRRDDRFRLFGWRHWVPTCVLLAVLGAFLVPFCGWAVADGAVSAGVRARAESKKKTVGLAGGRDTVHIAFVVMSTTSPHALINQKYRIFDEQLAKIGKKVKYTATRSLDNLFPLLDSEDGSPDFVYLPHEAFATYNTKMSKYGGGDEYAIVAGSLDLSDIDLVTRPEIRALSDLAGKKIAISNMRYLDEFHLNKLLATVGLSTETMGGSVEIVWDDIVRTTLENYGKGLYDGVVVFNTDNRDLAVLKVPGSGVHSLNPEGLYGGQHPRVWMVAKKEIIKNAPVLVRSVLRAHVLLDDKAREDRKELASLNRRAFLDYFKTLGVDISDRHPIDQFEERWKQAIITYDPNMQFIEDVFNFMRLKGVYRGMSMDEFVQIEPLNEALEEMGRPEISQKLQ